MTFDVPVFNKEKAVIPYHVRCLARQSSWVFTTCVASPYGTGKYATIDVVFEDAHVQPKHMELVVKDVTKTVTGYIERHK